MKTLETHTKLSAIYQYKQRVVLKYFSLRSEWPRFLSMGLQFLTDVGGQIIIDFLVRCNASEQVEDFLT